MPKKPVPKPEKTEIQVNDAELPKRTSEPKPINWIDSFELTARPSENLILLVGHAINPDMSNMERYEICRLMITAKHAVGLVDVLAKITNHYPEKPLSDKAETW